MSLNQNSGYGQAMLGAATAWTLWKTFVVASTTEANINNLRELILPDSDWVQRLHATITSALAACTADHGDVVYLAQDFDTAPTAAELLAAETKGVRIEVLWTPANGVTTVTRATWVLAQTADLSIFTVTGRVELISIIGEVTTAIQNQANATLIKINPTVGADVDLCAALDIDNDAVGTNYSITWTLADAMVATTSGAWVYQANSLLLTAWVVELECAASNTWSIKWTVQYRPIDAWARMIAA